MAGFARLMQADAYAGFNRLYEADRKGGPIIEAACCAHARRKFFDLAKINQAPIAARRLHASMRYLPSNGRSTAPGAAAARRRAHRAHRSSPR